MTHSQISHQDLRTQLSSGIVRFLFRKLDGGLRVALGTLDTSKIPQQMLPKGGEVSEKHVAYYDVEKASWRSVSCSQEVWISKP